MAGKPIASCDARSSHSTPGLPGNVSTSHAACYALISYRTAWLKANYPAEYMAALISSVMSTKDRVPFYVAACDDMGIEVEPPDVNVSVEDFRVVEGRIRLGLNAVKNVGESAVRSILAARDLGRVGPRRAGRIEDCSDPAHAR